MVNEMARELVNIPKYEAFAKVVEESGGEQKVWKGKIRTVKLSAVPEGSARALTALTQGPENAPYLRRSEIEEEIRQRPVRWRERLRDKPAVQTGGRAAASPGA